MAISSIDLKIDNVPVAVFVGRAFHRVSLPGRMQQFPAEELGVVLRQPQRGGEDAGFVPAPRMIRAEAVIAKLRNLNNRIGAAGKLHP